MYVDLCKLGLLMVLHTLLFLLMIDLGIPGSISLEGKVTYLSILKSFEIWLKNKQESALKYSDLIKGVNINQKHLTPIVNLMEFNNSSQCHIPLSKMVLLSDGIEHWWNLLVVCCK